MTNEPFATATNGRFQPGNTAAVGHSSRSQKLRQAMLAAVTETDLQAIVAKLIDMARGGDLRAAKLLIDLVGKPTGGPIQPTPGDNSERIREIVERLQERRDDVPS